MKSTTRTQKPVFDITRMAFTFLAVFITLAVGMSGMASACGFCGDYPGAAIAVQTAGAPPFAGVIPTVVAHNPFGFDVKANIDFHKFDGTVTPIATGAVIAAGQVVEFPDSAFLGYVTVDAFKTSLPNDHVSIDFFVRQEDSPKTFESDSIGFWFNKDQFQKSSGFVPKDQDVEFVVTNPGTGPITVNFRFFTAAGAPFGPFGVPVLPGQTVVKSKADFPAVPFPGTDFKVETDSGTFGHIHTLVISKPNAFETITASEFNSGTDVQRRDVFAFFQGDTDRITQVFLQNPTGTPQDFKATFFPLKSFVGPIPATTTVTAPANGFVDIRSDTFAPTGFKGFVIFTPLFQNNFFAQSEFCDKSGPSICTKFIAFPFVGSVDSPWGLARFPLSGSNARFNVFNTGAFSQTAVFKLFDSTGHFLATATRNVPQGRGIDPDVLHMFPTFVTPTFKGFITAEGGEFLDYQMFAGDYEVAVSGGGPVADFHGWPDRFGMSFFPLDFGTGTDNVEFKFGNPDIVARIFVARGFDPTGHQVFERSFTVPFGQETSFTINKAIFPSFGPFNNGYVTIDRVDSPFNRQEDAVSLLFTSSAGNGLGSLTDGKSTAGDRLAAFVRAPFGPDTTNTQMFFTNPNPHAITVHFELHSSSGVLTSSHVIDAFGLDSFKITDEFPTFSGDGVLVAFTNNPAPIDTFFAFAKFFKGSEFDFVQFDNIDQSASDMPGDFFRFTKVTGQTSTLALFNPTAADVTAQVSFFRNGDFPFVTNVVVPTNGFKIVNPNDFPDLLVGNFGNGQVSASKRLNAFWLNDFGTAISAGQGIQPPSSHWADGYWFDVMTTSGFDTDVEFVNTQAFPVFGEFIFRDQAGNVLKQFTTQFKEFEVKSFTASSLIGIGQKGFITFKPRIPKTGAAEFDAVVFGFAHIHEATASPHFLATEAPIFTADNPWFTDRRLTLDAGVAQTFTETQSNGDTLTFNNFKTDADATFYNDFVKTDFVENNVDFMHDKELSGYIEDVKDPVSGNVLAARDSTRTKWEERHSVPHTKRSIDSAGTIGVKSHVAFSKVQSGAATLADFGGVFTTRTFDGGFNNAVFLPITSAAVLNNPDSTLDVSFGFAPFNNELLDENAFALVTMPNLKVKTKITKVTGSGPATVTTAAGAAIRAFKLHNGNFECGTFSAPGTPNNFVAAWNACEDFVSDDVGASRLTNADGLAFFFGDRNGDTVFLAEAVVNNQKCVGGFKQTFTTNMPSLTRSISLVINKDGNCVPSNAIAFSGSQLEVTYPAEMDWTALQMNYPLLLESDSSWTVDITPYLPAGYSVSPDSAKNVQVTPGQTLATVFLVKTNSPPPNVDFDIRAQHQGSAAQTAKVHVEAHATDAYSAAQANKQAHAGGAAASAPAVTPPPFKPSGGVTASSNNTLFLGIVVLIVLVAGYMLFRRKQKA